MAKTKTVVQESADQVIYVAVFQNYWGKGRTREEAVKQARKAGGKGSEYYVKRMPRGAVEIRVNDFGGINWRWHPDVAESRYDEQPVLCYCGKGVNKSKLSEQQQQELKDNWE